MKNRSLMAALFAVVIMLPISAHAIMLSVEPNVPSLETGEELTVAINISDLGDGVAPSLSVFDLDLSFDSAVLGFSSASFGGQLDLFGLGNLQLATEFPGVVNLFELSFDFASDLDTLQLPVFTLVELTFDAVSPGSSALELSILSLGDSLGDAIDASVSNSTVRVSELVATVPVPGTLALLLAGLVGIIGAQHKLKR